MDAAVSPHVAEALMRRFEIPPPAPVSPGPAGPASDSLRTRAAQAGLDSLADDEALELALARVAGRAAGGLARRLLDRFGSLPEVLGASRSALEQVVPQKVALELQFLHGLHLRALRTPLRRRPVLSSWSAVCDYLRIALAAEPREQFRVLFLDKRNRLIRDETMGYGTIDHAPVYPREVARRVLELSAAAVVLAHNHPAGDPTPSPADVDMTRQVAEALKVFRVPVHDHLVVGGDGVASFRALGLL